MGSTIGLGLGLFFAGSIGKPLEEDGFTTYHVPYVGVAAMVVISALFGILAAPYRAWRAGRLNVLDATATEQQRSANLESGCSSSAGTV